QAGDWCLKEIAHILKSKFLRSGDFPARIGGEEFTVILPDIPEEEAFSLAENFRNLVAEKKFLIHGRTECLW
ncbi:MAG: diguanylate cyclase, partial [Leptolyngbya sp.]|nr:diguanylate cyclase [Candidatus Melainabacteria bacterium]